MKDRLDPKNRLPSDLAREILGLSDRDRVQVFEFLREDLAASGSDLPDHRADGLNEKMRRSIEALDRFREEQNLDETAFLALTIKDYEEGRKSLGIEIAAQAVAQPFDQSWLQAKQVANGGKLPPTQSQKWKRKTLARRARRSHNHLAGVLEWLDTPPVEETIEAYDEWRERRNREIQDGRPYVAGITIRQRFQLSWDDVMERARQLQPDFDLEEDEDEEEDLVRLPSPAELPKLLSVKQVAELLNVSNSTASGLVAADKVPHIDIPSVNGEKRMIRRVPLKALVAGLGGNFDLSMYTTRSSPEELLFDGQLVARRLKQARAAMGWNKRMTAKKAGLESATLSRIENGITRELTIGTVVRLAHAFKVSTDFFLSPDGDEI